MTDREYSLAEIDRMRSAIGYLNWWRGSDKDRIVEDRLRSYMAAGIEPGELACQAKALSDAHERQMERTGRPITATSN